jgi:predicted permease
MRNKCRESKKILLFIAYLNAFGSGNNFRCEVRRHEVRKQQVKARRSKKEIDLRMLVSDNMPMHVINTISPVFLLIALGLFLRLGGFISDDFAKSLNRLAYWVGLPCLLFYKVASTEHDFAAAGKTFLVVFSATIASVIIGYLAALVMRIPVASWGTFVQGAHRGNLAYVGLAVVIYSVSGNSSSDASSSASTEAIAVMVVAMIIPVFNVISVSVLLLSKHALDGQIFGKIIRGVITNPLIIACLCGLLYSFAFDSLPLVFARSLNAIGGMALPIALLAIGASLAGKKVVCENFKAAFAASIIKTFFAPLVGYFVGISIGLAPGEMLVAMIFLASPTAVASYVMTQEIGGNAALSARVVIISTVLSAISLALAVGLF